MAILSHRFRGLCTPRRRNENSHYELTARDELEIAMQIAYTLGEPLSEDELQMVTSTAIPGKTQELISQVTT
jgi:hypothetical protein